MTYPSIGQNILKQKCFIAPVHAVEELADQVGNKADAMNYLRSRVQSVAPRSQRNIASARSLPAAQPMIQAHDDLAGLYGSAFGAGRLGCAEMQLNRAESIAQFGKSGVTLAVRSFGQIQYRATAPAAGRKITLLVAPYDNSTCDLGGGLRERYKTGCFATGLNQDPRVLWGHIDQCVLGRKSAGNARFWETSEGLFVEVDCVNTSYADDVLELVRTQTVNQCSAAFWILEQRFENRGSQRIRVVERAVLRDANIVSYPAYETTSAQVLQLPAASQAALPAANSVATMLAKLEREMESDRLRLQIARLPEGSMERNRLRLDLMRL